MEHSVNLTDIFYRFPPLIWLVRTVTDKTEGKGAAEDPRSTLEKDRVEHLPLQRSNLPLLFQARIGN
jgi:hypothetical protein